MSKHPLLSDFKFNYTTMLSPKIEGERHVDNVAFFQFFDDARISYLSQAGCLTLNKKTGIGHMIVSNHCDYLAELLPRGELLVGVKMLSMGKHTIKLGFRLVSTSQNCTVAEGYSVALTFDFFNSNKVAVPEKVRQAVLKLEG